MRRGSAIRGLRRRRPAGLPKGNVGSGYERACLRSSSKCAVSEAMCFKKKGGGDAPPVIWLSL